jgi:hypothetical protein
VAQATYKEISASDSAALYNQGYSMCDLVETTGFSYTLIRNMLLKSGVKIRTKREAFQSLFGVFMSCKKREEVMNILNSWYKEQGGDIS